jgi:hypothetical protein
LEFYLYLRTVWEFGGVVDGKVKFETLRETRINSSQLNTWATTIYGMNAGLHFL